ncbi:hypothetical protein [uncultured Amnibacterium sp.]|uniref:hypothetical protein n=1 Tax=uncultured Amnibacterium sp. TaxID=1631851 RepID=UPI0035C9710F
MTLVVRGEGLTATVDPVRGAKIVSLVDAAGVEWLAQADRTSIHAPGTAFVAAEMAGWDECAPSIVACTVDDAAIPDHGELWDVPFDTRGDTTIATGTSLGFRFARTIAPAPSGLVLSYRAETTGESIPFLWAAHPQFAAPPGTRVELLPQARSIVDVQHHELPIRTWSSALGRIDSVPPGGTRKWYVDPAQTVRGARLVRGDGPVLTMEWSDHCPYLGVWFDHSAYSREPVIAIEPSTGYFDSLATAVRSGRVATLRPGRPLTWWVRLRAHPASA